MITIHAREALFIKKEQLPAKVREELIKKYRLLFFEEKACKECDFLPDRLAASNGLSENCENCAAFKGGAELATNVIVGKNKYLKTPIGDQRGLERVLEKHDIEFNYKEHFPSNKFKRPIKFTGKFRGEFQKESANSMIHKKRGVIKSPPRSGKCIVGSSLIMTEKGLHPIKDLFLDHSLSREGETVIDSDLTIATVKGDRSLSHLYTKVVDETIKIDTYCGYSIQGTPNHKLLVARPGLRLVWVKFCDIREGDYLAISRKPQWFGQGQDLLSNKEGMPTSMTRELARLLGYWIANGSLSVIGRLSVSTNNKEVQKDFVRCLNKVFPELNPLSRPKNNQSGRAGGVTVSSRKVYTFLQEATGLMQGTARSKTIPNVLFKVDRQFMLEFLGAYITCDAWIDKRGLQLCSASKELITELHTVLTYLGVIGRKTVGTSYARNGSPIVRSYHSIWLHKNESDKLLDQLTIRKGHLRLATKYINQHEEIPFLKKTLRDTQDKYSVGHSWLHKGRAYSKIKVGGFLYSNRKGLQKGDHYHRSKVANINLEVLKWVDPKVHSRLQQIYDPSFYFTPVTSKRIIKRPVRVYDVSVPVGHHFIANSIVSHNTVQFAAAITKIGKKTIILASQREWLKGFQETFIGSETQIALTNCKPSQIGFARKYEDFLKYDICLVTVQTFYSKAGQKLLEKIRDMFPVLGVDEIDTGAAPKYATVIASLNCQWKIGLTGTPSRKDGRFSIMRGLIGPNIYEATVERLRPHIRLVRTAYKPNYKGQVHWTRMVSAMEKNPQRLKLIAQWAVKDVNDGHMVLIPLSQVTPVKALVMAINKIAGKKIAYPFWGGLAGKKDSKGRLLRDVYINAARNYKIKVLVGTNQLIKRGTNIPRASAIYETYLSSNKENAEQRISRILTPWDDKPPPILRMFMDDFQVRKRCFAMEWYQVIKPVFKPVLSEQDRITFEQYLKSKTMDKVKL